MSFSFFATCLVLTMATSAASGFSLRANVAPLTASTYYMYTSFSDSGCTTVMDGSGTLLGTCMDNGDGTYTKLTDPGTGTTYTSTTYTNSACSTGAVVNTGTLITTCSTASGGHHFVKAIMTTTPSYTSTTAGAVMGTFTSTDTSCTAATMLNYVATIDVCDTSVTPPRRATYAGTTVSYSQYSGAADCSGTASSTTTWTSGTCGLSKTGGSGYQTVTYNVATSVSPTAVPSMTPTMTPTATPTATPTVAPSTPTATPTVAPSTPTATPTVAPSTPTATPTSAPSATPTATPTVAPSTPTVTPTKVPTATPTVAPTKVPTATPTSAPSATPTVAPTKVPTATPTAAPSAAPSTAVTKSCFAGSETVIMESGDVKAISAVQIGDRVLAADSNGKTLFSDVVFIPHGANKESALFAHISTVNGRDVKVTPNHILPAGVCGSSSLPLVYASEISVGDCIQTVSGEEKVSMVEQMRGEGVYTIVTKEEFIVVNGIIASPFGANHMMANMFYNVHRLVYASAPALLTSALLHSANEALGMLIPYFGKSN